MGRVGLGWMGHQAHNPKSARIILVGRDERRGNAVVAELAEAARPRPVQVSGRTVKIEPPGDRGF